MNTAKMIDYQELKNLKPYQLMWRLICCRPVLYTFNGLIWTFIHLAPLIPGLIAREFFDTLTGNARLDVSIWGLLILLIIVNITRIGIIYIGATLDILHRFSMSAILRRNLLKSLLHQPGANVSATSSSETITYFREDVKEAENSISWTLDLIGSTIFALVAIGILLNINTRVTLLVFTPLIAVVATAHWASKRIEKYRKASRSATEKITGAIGEMFGAVQAVQVAGAQKPIISHFSALNEERLKLSIKDTMLSQLLDSIFKNTVSLGIGLILLLAAQSMHTKTFSVGDFALFTYYLTFVTDFTQFFGSFLAHYQQVSVSYNRMGKLLNGEPNELLVNPAPIYLTGPMPEVSQAPKMDQDRLENLEIRDLNFAYSAPSGGIKNINLKIAKGSFTVITGRVGSGKTTLLRTILGLLPADSGQIYWNGQLIEDPANFFIPPRSSYTAQIPHLFSESLRDNILMGLPEISVNLDNAIYSAVLESDLEQLEDGLDTIIGPRGVKLSGGQLQRVAAARMFAHEAELFVFDDISSALDIDTETKLWNRIFQRQNATCLVVSNRRTALQFADKIIVLKDGQIEAEGTLAKLQQTCEELQKILAI